MTRIPLPAIGRAWALFAAVAVTAQASVAEEPFAMAGGASGTLAGSVFESLGFHYQSMILDTLTPALTGSLGGLVYLIGICVVIFHAAVKGKYDLKGWILIGPPLYFAVIGIRTETANSNWLYGGRPRSQAEVDDQVQKLRAVSGDLPVPRVSKLFERYNRLVSAAAQEIIGIISEGRTESDWWFIIKAELHARLHINRIREPGFEALVHRALFQECGRLVDRALALNNPTVQQNGAAYDAALADFRKSMQETRIKLDPLSAQYLSTTELAPRTPADIMNMAPSCQDVWNWVYRGLERRAKQALDSLCKDAENNHIDCARFINLMLRANGLGGGRIGDPAQVTPADVELLVRLIAFYTLRNEVHRRSFGAWVASLEAGPDVRDASAHLVGHNATTETARLNSREWGERTRLMAAAGNLPYYQGFALYFLAVLFPFFALLLLIPGKTGGFLLWFVLWLWVKSWDCAIALVMFLDDLLFAMLAAGRERNGELFQLDRDMALTMRSLEMVDPSFNMATYYSLIAVSILSIPPVTAQLILGSLQGGAGLIAQGIDRFAGHFADAVQARVQQGAINALRFRSRALAEKRTRDYLQADSDGTSRYAKYRDPTGDAGIRGPGRSGLQWGVGLDRQGRVNAYTAVGAGFGRGLENPNTIAGGLVDMAAAGSAASKRAGIKGAPDAKAFREKALGPVRGNSGWKLLRGFGGAAGELGDTFLGNSTRIFDAEIETSREWARWDSDLSTEGRQLMQLARAYGCLEIPWINASGDPFKAELNRKLAEIRNDWEWYRGGFAAGRAFLDKSMPDSRPGHPVGGVRPK